MGLDRYRPLDLRCRAVGRLRPMRHSLFEPPGDFRCATAIEPGQALGDSNRARRSVSSTIVPLQVTVLSIGSVCGK